MISYTLLMAAVAAGPAPTAPATGTPPQAIGIMPDDEATRKILTDATFSEALVVGDTVYVSGVVVGIRPGDTNLEAAYVNAFDRIGKALAKAGATWDDVVEITSFHTDVALQAPIMRAVKARYLKPPFPAWTAVGVTRLVPNTGITEIKLEARIRPRPAAAGGGAH